MTTNKLDQLVHRVGSRDSAALARAISLVELSSSIAGDVHEAIKNRLNAAPVIGITGTPGVGKSTLVNGLIRAWRSRNQRIAVIAVDPSSPISGGAVLGDRTRMGEHSEDQHVFIRSLAARGHLGGLNADVLCILDLIDFAGWDIILLETVGTGQSETEVAQVADINVVVNAPGLGDDVQASKAGILEIADILVINKADHPLANRTEAQLKGMLDLRKTDQQQVPILKTVATEGEGIPELADTVEKLSNEQCHKQSQLRHQERARRLLAEQMAQQVRSLILGGADLDSVRATLQSLEQN